VDRQNAEHTHTLLVECDEIRRRQVNSVYSTDQGQQIQQSATSASNVQ